MEKNRQECKLGVTENERRFTAVQQASTVRESCKLAAELEQQKKLLDKFKVELRREIEKREAIEAVLRENGRKLKQFIQSMPAICLILDEDGNIVECFDNADKQSRTVNKDTNKSILEQFFRQTSDILLNRIRLTIQTGDPQSVVCKISMAGGIRFFECRMSSMRYLTDTKRTVAAIILDVTERWEDEHRLHYSYVLQRRSDFINTIIDGDLPGSQQLAVEAKTYGIDYSSSFYCCLLVVSDWTAITESGITIPPVRAVTKLIGVLENGEDCVIWNAREGIGVLACLPDCSDACQTSMQFAENLEKKVKSFDASLSVWIGISNPQTGYDGIKYGFQQAQGALAAARCLEKDGKSLCHFRDIGVVQLLAGLDNKQALEFVQENLEEIIRYDAKKGTNLLQTLEVLLESSNLKEAADKMYIHHKTIAFRKQRIEKIMAVSLDNFETKMVLSAAIKLYRLYFL